jgi:hypothetical protein
LDLVVVVVEEGVGEVDESGQGSEDVVDDEAVHDSVVFPEEEVLLLRRVVTCCTSEGEAVTDTVMLTVSVRVVTAVVQLEVAQGPPHVPLRQKEPGPRCLTTVVTVVVLTRLADGVDSLPSGERLLKERNAPEGREFADEEEGIPEGGAPVNAAGMECIRW